LSKNQVYVPKSQKSSLIINNVYTIYSIYALTLSDFRIDHNLSPTFIPFDPVMLLPMYKLANHY